ncbi:hypothetical protein BT69DRAFT_1288563 [Atractiella rhizophila]|nr:hypothetical protein BT69DRAFT_1288563 [Atractiella rhizophila]
MTDLQSIHNHAQLVKLLGTTFSSIGSDLKRWDEAWKAFYLLTPFSTCIQAHQILTLFDICLQTWRSLRSDGEGLAAGFADWEGNSDWDTESHHIWAQSVLFQLQQLLVAAESQLHLATRMSSLQTELLRNCHDHLRFVNAASYLWFWRRPAQLYKRRDFDYLSDNLHQQFLVIKSCSKGLLGFWKEVEAYLQGLRAGRLHLQRSLILVSTSAWLDCSNVYGDVVPDHFLHGRALKLSVDFLQLSPKFRQHPPASSNNLHQTPHPPVAPRPLPSDSDLYAMTLSSIGILCNRELEYLVLSLKWANAAVEARWFVPPAEVRLVQEDLRFILLLMIHDYECFVNDFLIVFEKLLLGKNLNDEKAKDSVSKLHHSFSRTSIMLSSFFVFLEPASELLSHSITCQLERAESSAGGLLGILTWLRLQWYQFWSLQPTAYSVYFTDRVLPLSFGTTTLPQDELAKDRMTRWKRDLRQSRDRLWSLTSAVMMHINQTLQEMVQSAENGDAGSSHIRVVFQENAEALRIQVGDLVAFRENFEKDADFLRGEYNPTVHVNWSRTRPEIQRVRRW